jgi:multiple sugar transport system substrate-binding protein
MVLILALLAVGCGNGGGDNSAAAGSGGDGSAGKGEKVNLRLTIDFEPARYEAYKALVDKWNGENPNIQVKLENLPSTEYQKKLQVMTASNTLPDLFTWQPGWGAEWLHNEKLLPIDDYVNNDPDLNKDDFLEVMMKYLTYEGKLHGLPYDVGADVMFYNKDLFDQAGLPYPTNDWTYDDVREAAKKINETVKSDKGKVYGLISTLTNDWRSESFYLSFGANLIDKNGKVGINNEGGIQALQYFKDNIDMGITPKPESGTTFSTIWMNGLGAMMFEGGWNIPTYEKAGFKWDIVKLPKGPAGQFASGLGGTYVISKQSKHPDEAYKFLKYLTSTEGLNDVVTKVNGGVPARISSQEGLTPIQKKYSELIANASYFNDVNGALELFEIHKKEIEQLWFGQKTAAEVVQTVQEKGDKVLEQKGKK